MSSKKTCLPAAQEDMSSHVQREDASSCSTRADMVLVQQGDMLLGKKVGQEDMSSCSTSGRGLSLNAKTCLLVEQEDMPSGVEREDVSSCPTSRHVFLLRTTNTKHYAPACPHRKRKTKQAYKYAFSFGGLFTTCVFNKMENRSKT